MARPTDQIKNLESEVNLILRKADFSSLSRKNREALAELQSAFSNARRYALDFEGSEDPKEQSTGAKTAKKWLKLIRHNILLTSEYNVFNAIEVASLSAQIDLICSRLTMEDGRGA